MNMDKLLRIVGREPVFSSSLLGSEDVRPADLGRQLSRWVKSGRIIQLRRGLYTLSERDRKTTPHPFLIANLMKWASYVSLQSALAYYDLIPESVPSVTSIATGRPETLTNPLGSFIYRHVRTSLFFGYRIVDLGEGQSVFLAAPEKALLDLLYLTPDSDDPDYLRELRLQNMESLNVNILTDMSAKSASRKLQRATSRIISLMDGKEMR